tara:strand:- start:316 stop:1338 length:1023 start_codon:yes stop_codon:yes gene_type:complete
MWYEYFLDRGLIPFLLVKYFINRLNGLTDTKLKKSTEEDRSNFSNLISQGPIAYDTEVANQQHYEVTSEFFQSILGPRLKYSSCFWDESTSNLEDAEIKMLNMYIERCEIRGGLSVLDLGCGWGSVTLYLAEKFPDSKFTCLSNSETQIKYIKTICNEKNLDNVTAIKSDINDFAPQQKFDRVISIEMFEHMHNLKELFKRISLWMTPDAILFIHVFSHKDTPYFFLDEKSWMAKHFFRSGLMPSYDLFDNFSEELLLTQSWLINGTHYQRTLDEWEKRLRSNKQEILKIFQKGVDKKHSLILWRRWRIFLAACSSLFGFNSGDVWFVAHHKFRLRETHE